MITLLCQQNMSLTISIMASPSLGRKPQVPLGQRETSESSITVFQLNAPVFLCDLKTLSFTECCSSLAPLRGTWRRLHLDDLPVSINPCYHKRYW